MEGFSRKMAGTVSWKHCHHGRNSPMRRLIWYNSRDSILGNLTSHMAGTASRKVTCIATWQEQPHEKFTCIATCMAGIAWWEVYLHSNMAGTASWEVYLHSNMAGTASWEVYLHSNMAGTASGEVNLHSNMAGTASGEGRVHGQLHSKVNYITLQRQLDEKVDLMARTDMAFIIEKQLHERASES